MRLLASMIVAFLAVAGLTPAVGATAPTCVAKTATDAGKTVHLMVCGAVAYASVADLGLAWREGTGRLTTAAGVKPAGVLLKVAGSGAYSSRTFMAPPSWRLAWSYDCSSFGAQGNFQVYIYQNGVLSDSDIGANALGPKGSAVNYYHSGGRIYLEINSECSWHVLAER